MSQSQPQNEASAVYTAPEASATASTTATTNTKTQAAPAPKVQADTVTTKDKVAWMTVIMLGMLAAFGPVCTDIYLPAIPMITAELNADPAAVQLSLTSSLMGLAFGQLFIGPISDAYGRKKPLYISLIVFAIASVGCALAPDVPTLIVARLFQGLAGAGGIVLSRTIACDMYTGTQLTQFMALLMSVNSLAPILGPIIGSAVISIADWPMLFFILAIWGVLLFLGSATSAVKETLPVEKRAPHLSESVKDMLRQLVNMRFLLLACSMSFIMGGFFGYLSSSPFIFQVIFGLSPVGYALVFAVNAIIISVVANIAGKISRRVSEKIIVKVCLAVQFLVSLIMAAVVFMGLENIIVVAACLCVYVSMMGAAQTAGFGLVMGARSGGAGSASGIFGVLTFLFGAVASPLVGLMGEHSMVPQIICMLVSSVLAYVCFVVGLRIKTLRDIEIDLHAEEGSLSDNSTHPIHRKQPKTQS